jgi:hypothetical protein
MRGLRIIGLALLALLALGVLGASLALAEEGVLEPANFTIKGGTITITNLNNETLICKAVTGSGAFLTEKEKDQHAEGTLDLTGCTASGFSANTLGDAAGTLLFPVLFLFCLTNPATLLFGILILFTETVHIEIPIIKALLLLKGAFIGSLTKAGELEGKEFAVSFNEPDEAKRIECEINKLKFKSTLEGGIDTKPDVDMFISGQMTFTFAQAVRFMDK